MGTLGLALTTASSLSDAIWSQGPGASPTPSRGTLQEVCPSTHRGSVSTDANSKHLSHHRGSESVLLLQSQAQPGGRTEAGRQLWKPSF